jgi:hypothetical protein
MSAFHPERTFSDIKLHPLRMSFATIERSVGAMVYAVLRPAFGDGETRRNFSALVKGFRQVSHPTYHSMWRLEAVCVEPCNEAERATGCGTAAEHLKGRLKECLLSTQSRH